MSKRNRSGAEQRRARKRRLAQEAEQRWLEHFGPERPGRDVTWSSISPTPNTATEPDPKT